MKTVKITLAVIVIAAITLAIIKSIIPIIDSAKIQLPKNQFIKKIEQKIEILKKMPESSFCENFYKEIEYYINDDYSNNRLGKTQLENKQWKENLSSNLYAAYTDKFIQQSFYVFKGTQWDEQKLVFIRSEYQVLKRNGLQTGMLEKNSITDNKLNQIGNIISKYDEITRFVNSCKAFSFSKYADLNASFPISEVETKIIRSKGYLGNNLDNFYVKNCKRLETSLREVPQYLFKAHVKYLDKKIIYWNGKYDEYNSLSDYNIYLFTPLKNEIRQLYNDVYNGNSFVDNEYKKLNDKLELESNAAYNHSYN
jgi:hypothetical protein